MSAFRLETKAKYGCLRQLNQAVLVCGILFSIVEGSPSLYAAQRKPAEAKIAAPTLPDQDTVSARYPFPYGVYACSENERWFVPKSSKSQIRFPKEFLALVSGRGSKVVSFSEALSTRRLARTDAEKVFSEYWLARALFSGGLAQLAYQGFNVVVNQEIRPETIPFQLSALECLSVLHKKYPALELSNKLISQLVEVSRQTGGTLQDVPALRRSIQKIALSLMLTKNLSENSQSGLSDPRWTQALSLLTGKGSFEALVSGVYHSSKSAHTQAIAEFTRFFSSPEWESPLFKPYINQARLLYGRSLFSKERYREAIQQYKTINPRSNEWIHGLSEMSWAYLMDEKYQEAIGTAVGLQAGVFKQTFSPEVLMVMAMGLNEICRFPESMNVINNFRVRYRDAYRWLKAQTQSPSMASQNPDYYRLAIDFAKKTPKLPVPVAVASEWIRSPIFISNQEIINLVFEEGKLSDSLSAQGKTEQRGLTVKLISSIRKLRKEFEQAKIRMKPGENVNDRLSNATKQEMETVKNELIQLRHIKNAAPYWRKMLASYQARIPAIQTAAVTQVKQEIVRLNQRMLGQLDEISANNELIEVEILNGASDDMIWQNANPKLAEKVKKTKMQKMAAASEKVWNWGKTQGGFEGGGEIWEDEAGSLSAELYDNCKSKEKYAGV